MARSFDLKTVAEWDTLARRSTRATFAPGAAMIAALIALTGPAMADAVTVQPGRVDASSSGTSAIVTLTNAGPSVRLAHVSCALLGTSGEPLDETDFYVENVPAGGTAYKRFYFDSRVTTGGKLACRAIDLR